MRLDTGRLLPEVEASGPLADLFGVFGRLAQQIRGSPAPPALISDRLPPSPQVFELYVKGLVAETPSTALRVSRAGAEGGAAVRSRAPGDLGPPFRSRPSISARSTWCRPITHGEHAFSRGPLSARAVADGSQAVRRCAEDAAGDADGISRRRRWRMRSASPSCAGSRRTQPGRATYYFSQASELDPERRRSVLQSRLRLLARQGCDAPRSTGCAKRCAAIPAMAMRTSSSASRCSRPAPTTEATRERELADAAVVEVQGLAGARPRAGDPVPRGLERLHEELMPSRARVDNVISTAGQRDQEKLAAFHLDAGRRAFEREADREAIDELRRALYLSPYLAEAHLLLGRLYLRGGRAADAVEALKIALWSEATVPAHLGAGRGLPPGPGSGGGPRSRSSAPWPSTRSRPTPSPSRPSWAEGRGKILLRFCTDDIDPRRRISRNSAEREAARLSVHGRVVIRGR